MQSSQDNYGKVCGLISDTSGSVHLWAGYGMMSSKTQRLGSPIRSEMIVSEFKDRLDENFQGLTEKHYVYVLRRLRLATKTLKRGTSCRQNQQSMPHCPRPSGRKTATQDHTSS